jgi:hypothetical protein
LLLRLLLQQAKLLLFVVLSKNIFKKYVLFPFFLVYLLSENESIFTMKVSVELTLSPLQDEFEAPIIHFIKKLRSSGLIVYENPLSTQIYGEYDRVMEVLTNEVKEVFELLEKGLIYIKIVKSDRHDYEPHF